MTENEKDFEQSKLTAYALGELDPQEQSQVRDRLAHDPVGQEFVEQVRQTADLLQKQLQAEPDPPGLSDQQRSTIDAELDQTPASDDTFKGPSVIGRISWVRVGWVAAACLFGALLLPVVIRPQAMNQQSSISQNIEETGADADGKLALGVAPTGDSSPGRPVTVDRYRREAGRRQDHGQVGAGGVKPIDGTQALSSDGNASPLTDRQQRERFTQATEFDLNSALSNARTNEISSVEARVIYAKKTPNRSFGQVQTKPVNPAGGGKDSKNKIVHADPYASPLVSVFSAPQTLVNGQSVTPSRRPVNGLWGGRGEAPLGEVDHRPGRTGTHFDTESYDHTIDNPFLRALDNPLSTFSIDVDTASYANMRRYLMQHGQLPPKDAVRIEEMINYFPYDYAPPSPGDDHPSQGAPFAVHVETAAAPWAQEHRLVKIGLKGYEPDLDERPSANLVFLLDVSGSMSPTNKLPLLKRAMTLLVGQLTEPDRVAIVVYAGASGLVLDSTPAAQKDVILAALDRLQSGGSTNGGAGIELAYQIATRNFIRGGINRVILATDGDFNVGVTDRGSLVRLIEQKAQTGVYLTTLGFGTGNVKDATMEQLSNKGNGNYAYIDSIDEARKVLVEQMGGTVMTIAKDVKLQIEFNPLRVAAYRLIGYENRVLAKEDFNDDTKDAGDIGAGHTVTALYEIVPSGLTAPDHASARQTQEQIDQLEKQIQEIRTFMAKARLTAQTSQQLHHEISELRAKISRLQATLAARPTVDPLKYQRPAQHEQAANSDDLFTLKLRYKLPDAPKQQGTSRLITIPVQDTHTSLQQASTDFRFACAVASFGMILRDSPHKGLATFDHVLDLAAGGITRSNDPHGYRHQFVLLVKQAKAIANQQ